MSALFSAEVPQLGPLGILSPHLSVVAIWKKDCRLPRGGSGEQTYARYAMELVEHTLRAHIDFIFYTTLLLEEAAVIFAPCLLGCSGS